MCARWASDWKKKDPDLVADALERDRTGEEMLVKRCVHGRRVVCATYQTITTMKFLQTRLAHTITAFHRLCFETYQILCERQHDPAITMN